jgi:putative flavoprotein involved in K+ transport
VNGAEMGSNVEEPVGNVEVYVRVSDPDTDDAISKIELFEDGKVVATDVPNKNARCWPVNGISSDGASATFNDKLQEYIAFAQEGYGFLASLVEDWIAKRGNAIDYPPPTPEPEWEPHQPLLDYVAPVNLDLDENDVRSVLWCTGWGADLTWLKMPAARDELGPHGRPESCDTQVPGFFWLGFHWLRFLNSANVAGFHHDAPYIASRLR